MVKVWKDLNDLTFAEVPKKLKDFDKEMKSIPKFDKANGARKIYSKNEYNVYKVENGFIIHNTNKDFKVGHTHLKTFDMCKVLIDCSIKNKFPRTRNHYLLTSLIRISDNDKFRSKVKELIEVRENKEQNKYIIKR